MTGANKLKILHYSVNLDYLKIKGLAYNNNVNNMKVIFFKEYKIVFNTQNTSMVIIENKFKIKFLYHYNTRSVIFFSIYETKKIYIFEHQNFNVYNL